METELERQSPRWLVVSGLFPSTCWGRGGPSSSCILEEPCDPVWAGTELSELQVTLATTGSPWDWDDNSVPPPDSSTNRRGKQSPCASAHQPRPDGPSGEGGREGGVSGGCSSHYGWSSNGTEALRNDDEFPEEPPAFEMEVPQENKWGAPTG